MSAPPAFNMYISATQGATIDHPTQIVNYYPASPQASRIQVPPLPAHFIHREIEAAVRARCLEDGQPHAPSVLALHGMGGIGKSTLAAAVASDPDVARRFSDGILWAELKQEPDLSGLLMGWLQELGDYAFQTANTPGVSAHLRSLLREKSVLLIIDDVWEADHARLFLVGGPRSRTMLTTRRADVADELGAELIQLDALSPEQSLALLSARLQRPIAEGEREEALAVARELGHLPMALEMAATRVARGTPWLDLLLALEAEIAQLEALEGPRRRGREQARLQASFQLSLNALRTEDEPAWRAFCELGILADGATISVPLAATLWGIGETKAADLLELLWNEALLSLSVEVRIGDRAWRSYRLHNLLQDAALSLLTAAPPQGLGGSLPGVHADLIDRYAQRFSGGELRRLAGPDLPDDGYVHAHLLGHLEKSGRIADLHALLSSEMPDGRNGWFEARDRLSQVGGYLEDVARAWNLAASAAAARLAAGQPAPEVALEVRYALITATVLSMGGNIPPALAVRLLQEKIWSPEQALAYSRRALVDLAPHLPEPLLRELVARSLSKDIQARDVELLGALVPHLPPALRQELFAASQAMREEYRWSIQLSLVPYLDEPERLQVLTMISGLVGQINEYLLVDALRTLAPHLPEPKESIILDTLLRHWDTAEMMEIWVGHLLVFARQWMTAPETLRSFQTMLAARQQILGRFISVPPEEDVSQMSLNQFRNWLLRESPGADGGGVPEGIRVQAFLQSLVQMVPLFTQFLLRRMPNDQFEAWFLGRLTADASLLREFADYMFVQALDWCAPLLSEQLLDVSIERARGVRDPYVRLTALSRLMPHVGEAVREDACAEVVPLLREVEPGERLSILPEVAAYVPEPLLEEALGAVERIADERQRAEQLARLVPRLPSAFQARAVLAVRSLWIPFEWIEVYAAWLPAASEALKGELLTEATARARAVEGQDLRAHMFAKLAPHLPEDALPEALELASQLEKRGVIADLLQALSPRLPGSLVPQALEIARGLRDGDARSEALENLGPALLNKGDRQAALRAVRAIPDDLIRAKQLANLARHAPAEARSEFLQEALETVRKVPIQLYRRRGGGAFECRTAALAGIACELPEPEREALLSEALESELEQGAPGSNSPVLADLGFKLAELGNVEQALKAAGVVTPPPARVWVLAGIAERLPEARKPEVLAEALAGALAIEDTVFPQGVAPETERDDALADLAPRLVKDFPEGAWRAFEAIQGTAKRVEALVGMAPQLAERDRDEALETCQRMLADLTGPERARALAMLAGVLPEARQEMLQRALAEIHTIGDDRARCRALEALAPYLDETSLPEARTLAAEIADPDWLDQAQFALILRIAQVGEPEEALEALGALTNASFKAQCLRAMAHRLDEATQRKALRLAGELGGEAFYRQDEAHYPSGTVSRFPVVYQMASVFLDSLAPHLRSELRPEAYRVWSQGLRELALGNRKQLLRDLEFLAPVTAVLGGTEALAATARGIEDIGRWWP
jgi:NB-ARC domain-containing protein